MSIISGWYNRKYKVGMYPRNQDSKLNLLSTIFLFCFISGEFARFQNFAAPIIGLFCLKVGKSDADLNIICYANKNCWFVKFSCKKKKKLINTHVHARYIIVSVFANNTFHPISLLQGRRLLTDYWLMTRFCTPRIIINIARLDVNITFNWLIWIHDNWY